MCPAPWEKSVLQLLWWGGAVFSSPESTGQRPCSHRQRVAGDGFGVKPRPLGTGCQQGLRFLSWATQNHKATAETWLSTGSQGPGPSGLSVDIQLLIYRPWPVPSQMALPAQQADWAWPCDTETIVNPAQLAALGKRGGKKRMQEWMEGEQFKRVVRTERAVWSSVVTQQLWLGKILSSGRIWPKGTKALWSCRACN